MYHPFAFCYNKLENYIPTLGELDEPAESKTCFLSLTLTPDLVNTSVGKCDTEPKLRVTLSFAGMTSFCCPAYETSTFITCLSPVRGYLPLIADIFP